MRKSIHSPEQQVLRDLLRDLRREAGLKQTEVADRLGRPQSFVSKYEAGERRLDLIELRSVCAVLGTDVHELLNRLDEMTLGS
jgi:transcriptional regulator with XRE-family HTH domain